VGQAHIRREFYQDPAGRAAEAIPDIRIDKTKWFEHFDYDGNGTLEQDEIGALCIFFMRSVPYVYSLLHLILVCVDCADAARARWSRIYIYIYIAG